MNSETHNNFYPKKPEGCNTPHYALNSLSTLLFYLSILFFTIGFNLSDRMVGNWYQQFMPNLGGRSIVDITFTDSLNGYAVTSISSDTSLILKTTNSGNNWIINYTASSSIFKRVQFINSNTGFVGGTGLIKTTNSGNSWSNVNTSISLEDLYFIDNDTGWYVYSESLTGGVFFTSNGGASWTNQLALGSQNPNHIYMFNSRIGFVSKDNLYIRKTMNGGINWNPLTGTEGFRNIYFVDSLVGWKFNTQLKKTTDGGLSWILQPMPIGGMIFSLGIPDFSVFNKDTLISPSGYAIFPNNQIRGVLFRTTDGGSNWKFQIPDTGIHLQAYDYIEFTDKLHGWVYQIAPTGIHTTTGGDPVWYTGIKQISLNVPKDFILEQNYPNPFNPRTVIPFSLKKAAYIKITVYDITGKEIQKLADGKYNAGKYEVDFMGKFEASGVYFYTLSATSGKEVFSETKKMILVK